MPILPIDLQTLFSQTAQVGKEQAVQKDATPTAQSLQGAQLVQKTEVRDSSVNETRDDQEGAERVRDRERRGASRRRGEKKGAKPAPETPAPARAVYQDPALGGKIDVSG